MFSSRNGPPPVTKNSLTPSPVASRAIYCTRGAQVPVAAWRARNAHSSSRNAGYSQNSRRAKAAPTGKGDQSARPAAAQRSDQPRQQTRRKSLASYIQIDLSPHRNVRILQFPSHSETASCGAPYWALIHVSEPVSLTATSVRKMCKGLPSAVPRCSVENSRGPAFL